MLTVQFVAYIVVMVIHSSIIQPSLGYADDDRATSCIQMYCEERSAYDTSECEGPGVWHEKTCPAGQRICGFRTKLDLVKGSENDLTSTNNIDMWCCDKAIQNSTEELPLP